MISLSLIIFQLFQVIVILIEIVLILFFASFVLTVLINGIRSLLRSRKYKYDPILSILKSETDLFKIQAKRNINQGDNLPIEVYQEIGEVIEKVLTNIKEIKND